MTAVINMIPLIQFMALIQCNLSCYSVTYPVTYLGVTLDRTLSYKEHLTKTAGKLKNRNNLLMKLAGST